MSRLSVSAVSAEDYQSSVAHSAQDFTLSDLFAMNECPTLDFPCESADYYYKIGVLLYQLMYVNQNNEKAQIDDLKYGYLPVVVKTPRGKLFKVNKLGCMPNHEHNPCLYADDTVNEQSIIHSDALVKELLFAFHGFGIRNKKGEPVRYEKDDLSLLATSKTELTAFLETGETNHLFLAQSSQDRAIELLQGLNVADVAVVGQTGR